MICVYIQDLKLSCVVFCNWVNLRHASLIFPHHHGALWDMCKWSIGKTNWKGRWFFFFFFFTFLKNTCVGFFCCLFFVFVLFWISRVPSVTLARQLSPNPLRLLQYLRKICLCDTQIKLYYHKTMIWLEVSFK